MCNFASHSIFIYTIAKIVVPYALEVSFYFAFVH